MTHRTRKQILLALLSGPPLLACEYVASLFVEIPVALAFMVVAA